MSNETAVTKQSDNGIKSLMANEAVVGKFKEILGKNAPAFISSVTTIATTTALKDCEPKSILSAAIAAASLNLQVTPTLGFAAIVPYGNKAQFQIMTKGLWQLAMRSAQFENINVTEIYEGEFRKENRLTGEFDFSGQRKSDKVVGYVAYFKLLNGFSKSLYMTTEQIEAHAKRFSKTFNFTAGVWKTNFDAMARKTVLKLLLSRYAPLSTEIQLQMGVNADQAVVTTNEDLEITAFEYVDSEEQKPEPQVSSPKLSKEHERIVLLIKDCKKVKDLEKLAPNVPNELNHYYNERLSELSRSNETLELK